MRLTDLDTATKANEGLWVDISHPVTGKPTGMKVQILGADSKAYEKAEKEIRSDIMLGKTYDDPDGELALRTTIDWSGVEDDEGKAIPFSREALQIAFEKAPTIRDQIILKQKNRALFLSNGSDE